MDASRCSRRHPAGKHKRGTYLFNLFNLLTRVNSLKGIEANSRKFVAKEKHVNDIFCRTLISLILPILRVALLSLPSGWQHTNEVMYE